MIGDLRFRVRRAWGLGGPSKMKGRPRFDRAWARVACPCTNANRGSPSCMHVEGSRLPTTAMKGLPSIDHGQGSLYLARSIGSLRFSDLPLGLLARQPSKSGPGGPDSCSPHPEHFWFSLEGSTTSAQGWRAGWGTSLGNLRVSR